MPVNFGGTGVTPSLGALTSTEMTFIGGQSWLIPSGRWNWKSLLGYTVLQEYDPIAQIWRSIGGGSKTGTLDRIVSDGVNYRLANQTGCAVGAVVTTAGSAYTTAPTITVSAGSSVWKAVLGPYVSTITVNSGGTNYTYPPMIVIAPPPAGGVPATAHATMSGSAVSTIVVDNQGAGYSGGVPVVTIVNDPREGLNGTTVGSGAVATVTLAGSGTVAAVLCLDHGLGSQTAVPTLTFSSGSAAATVIMCWSITAYTVSTTTAGSGYTTPLIVSGYDTPPGSATRTNPATEANLVQTRNGFIVGALSAGALTATGQVVKDGGIYTAAPTMYVQSQGVFGAGPVQVTFTAATMGSQTDYVVIEPT